MELLTSGSVLHESLKDVNCKSTFEEDKDILTINISVILLIKTKVLNATANFSRGKLSEFCAAYLVFIIDLKKI